MERIDGVVGDLRDGLLAAARVERAYVLVYGRPVTDAERELALRYLAGKDDSAEAGRNQLTRWERYAQALLSLDDESVPGRQAMADVCRRLGDVEGEIAHRLFLALSPKNEIHPLLRLKDIHDLSSLILRKRTNTAAAQAAAQSPCSSQATPGFTPSMRAVMKRLGVTY